MNLPPKIENNNGLEVLRGDIIGTGEDRPQIRVWCRYCRAYHVHGWPDRITDPDHIEHRHCHCFDRPGRRASDSPYKPAGYMIGVHHRLTHKNTGEAA